MKNKGFTLIELILVIVVLMIMLYLFLIISGINKPKCYVTTKGIICRQKKQGICFSIQRQRVCHGITRPQVQTQRIGPDLCSWPGF